MAYQLILDLETTGNGTNKYHDIVEINAILERDGHILGEFNREFSFTSSTSFQGGINYQKAKENKESGKPNSQEGFIEFES